jgi:hypothetical protein
MVGLLFMSSRLILCGQLHRTNVFQDAPKMRLRREAHGSISVQEGQPVISTWTRLRVGLFGMTGIVPRLGGFPIK